MPMFDFVENNFDSLLRHVEQYYDFKQILVKVCSRASYARDQIASKIRASCEQDSIISRADRKHTCARDRDLIASKCTYDSEPHCNCFEKDLKLQWQEIFIASEYDESLVKPHGSVKFY